jgi:ribosomal protein S18 acetylase RimI-like enzyme
LLSMAVIGERRGLGVAQRLQSELLQRMAAMGIPAIKVVVGANNVRAITSYRRAGFEPAGTIEVHAGESSEVLVWKP